MTEQKRTNPDASKLPPSGSGAHAKSSGESIHSRSADPGQSSYGGFSGEDPRRQAQELEQDKAADRERHTKPHRR